MTRLERQSERYGAYHRETRDPGFAFAQPERSEAFRRLVGGPGRRVLDLGCRYGALTRAYLDGNDVVGVDVDRDALAEAARLGIEAVWADVDEPLPFEDASFDAVVCGELLEHVREPGRVVAEARRVLRPGGKLVGSVPNAYRLKNRLLFLAGRPLDDDPTHLHLFRPADLERLLAGLEDVRLEFAASRFIRVAPRLTANVIVFSGRKTAPPASRGG